MAGKHVFCLYLEGSDSKAALFEINDAGVKFLRGISAEINRPDEHTFEDPSLQFESSELKMTGDADLGLTTHDDFDQGYIRSVSTLLLGVDLSIPLLKTKQLPLL